MTAYGIVLIDDLRFFKDASLSPLIMRTEPEALAWVESLTADDTIEELWLDNDLGMDETGYKMEVIRAVNLLESKVFHGTAPSIGRVFVHTSNGVRANQMLAALRRHYNVIRVDAKHDLYGESPE